MSWLVVDFLGGTVCQVVQRTVACSGVTRDAGAAAPAASYLDCAPKEIPEIFSPSEKSRY